MVRVVYCVDTEGPLEETPEVAAHAYKPCLPTWAAVEANLAEATHARAKFPDATGGGVVFSWFVADNVGWCDNPRRKAYGYHAVYDRVRPYWGAQDAVGFHHHVVTPQRRALEYGTSWTATPYAETALCRRLLERGAFPAVFRAGGAVMRPDLAAYLDLFIPVDYSPHPPVGGPGEPMDWRRHPVTSRPVRVGGGRLQVRTVELDSRTYQMTAEDVERAFAEDGILAFAGHDRRPLVDDLARAWGLIDAVAAGRPWLWANALEAVAPDAAPIRWTIAERAGCVWFTADQPLYGAPFLAVDDHGLIYRDNPTQEGECLWAYRRPSGAAAVMIAGWPCL